jgi:response regulator RpfG family c-di-GMP phosphodiesterase
MNTTQTVRVAMAVTGDAACADLIAAMRGQPWDVTIAGGVAELASLAASGNYHMAVVACQDLGRLPAEPARTLMSLQGDMAVIFLAPDPPHVARCPALAWATSDQVHSPEAPVTELMALFKDELDIVCCDRTEYAVFCVDDDREFLASLRAFLPERLRSAFPRFDLNFQFIADPAEALAEAAALPPAQLAVVIADQIMPGMEGIELLKRLRGLCPTVHGVLLTGHTALSSAIQGINSRVLDRYFVKPIEEPADFVRSVESLLREHHLQVQASLQRHRMADQLGLIRALAGAEGEAQALVIAARFLQERLDTRRVVAALLTAQGYVVQAALGPATGLPVGAVLREGEWWGKALRSGRTTLPRNEDPMTAPTCRMISATPPLAVLPLSWGGRATGVLLAAGRADRLPFTRADRVLLNFVAEMTSVTVEGHQGRRALEDVYIGVMTSLMETVEAKDSYTRGHTERVTQLATALAQAAAVTPKQVKTLRWAAALHDIGKIAVPDAIILKAGPLTPQESLAVQEHALRADRILGPLKFLGAARRMVRSHHERYDGKGYPDGLEAEAIPLGARILAVADAYDAMTSSRAYRDAVAPEDALYEIEINAGRQFDPRLAAAFVTMMRETTCAPPQAPGPTQAAASKEHAP